MFHTRFTLVSLSFQLRVIPTAALPGIGKAAAEILANDETVVGVGLDSPSLDAGANHHLDAHHILFAKNKFGLENVADMSDVPPWGAT